MLTNTHVEYNAHNVTIHQEITNVSTSTCQHTHTHTHTGRRYPGILRPYKHDDNVFTHIHTLIITR